MLSKIVSWFISKNTDDKYENEKANNESISKIDTSNYRFDNSWNSFRNTKFNCYRYYYRFSIAYLVRRLKDSFNFREEQTEFFREYRKHSEYIGRIIFEAWGPSSNIFATCEYRDGRLERTNPSEPQLIDIGLARKHLQNGYPDLWKLKGEEEADYIRICDDIANKIESYQNIVLKEVDKEIKIEGGGSSALIRRENNYFPERIGFQSFYYKDSLLSSIFDEVTDRLYGREPDSPNIIEEHIDLRNERNRHTSVPMMICYYRDRRIAYGNEKQIREMCSRFQKLTSDSIIHEYVKDYYDLVHKLQTIENDHQFYESIKNIWKGMYQNGELLEGQGVCSKCPHKSFLSHF